MYIYKKTDYIVPESCDDQFSDVTEKKLIATMLIDMVKNEKLINLRRHIEMCDLCTPPRGIYLLISGNEEKISAGELLINMNGKNYIISTNIIHKIQIHNCKPSGEVLDAIKKFHGMKYQGASKNPFPPTP